MQGVSLWALLRDSTGTAPPRPDVYSEYYNAMPWHRDPTAQATMLRTARYKLVAVHSLGTGELYDLDRDAAETRNLWDDPEHHENTCGLLTRQCDRIERKRTRMTSS